MPMACHRRFKTPTKRQYHSPKRATQGAVNLTLFSQLYMSERVIIACEGTQWYLWDTPMDQLSAQFPVIRNELKPVDHLPHIGAEPVIWIGTQYWVSNPLEERFSILARRPPGGIADDPQGVFKTYSIGKSARDSESGDGAPAVITLSDDGTYPVDGILDGYDWAPMFKPGMSQFSGSSENLAFCARSNWEELVVGFLPPASSQNPVFFRPMTGERVTEPDASFEDSMIGFCAGSGRLVYRARDQHGVFISDYLRSAAS